MFFRKQRPGANALRTMGLVSLILAGVARWFLHPAAGFGPSLVDATIGLLYGVSIGCLLMSLPRGDRQCPNDHELIE